MENAVRLITLTMQHAVQILDIRIGYFVSRSKHPFGERTEAADGEQMEAENEVPFFACPTPTLPLTLTKRKPPRD